METFVNSQDTTLLQGAVLSALQTINSVNSKNESSSKKCSSLRDQKEALEIISSFVLKLLQNTSKVGTEMEFLRMQQSVNQRLHSVVFFVALRSNDFTCAEADKYYESVSHNFPSIDWKFYIKLNYLCHWSEYFIECAIQLNPDILALLIKELLYTSKTEVELKHYIWHLSLQAIAWKFSQFDDPSIINPSKQSAFPFQFTNDKAPPPDDLVVNVCENPAKSKLLHAYVTILNQISASSELCYDFTKVVLHFFKTLFKIVSQLNTCHFESIKELFRMNVHLKSCLFHPTLMESIHSDKGKFFLDHRYANASWDISPKCLLFLVYNQWMDASKKLQHDKDGCFLLISSVMPSNEETEKLNSLQFEIFKNESDFELLKAVIRYNYSFASRASAVILMYPEIYIQPEVIYLLKKHSSNLEISVIYPLLVDVVMKSNSAKVKNTYLKLFFDLLSNDSIWLYNEALEYIFQNYGLNNHFKLPEINACLLKFSRNPMPLKKAEKFLLPLFIQQPIVVLSALVEQALAKGEEGIALIPVLKLIPVACCYKDNHMLIEELSYYFLKDKFDTYEEKNFVSLINYLMEIQAEKEILSFDMFLEICVLPSLSKNIRTNLVWTCLNVSLEVLSSGAAFSISDEPFFSLMKYLIISINDCIKLGDGKRKDMHICTLSTLGKIKTLQGKFSEVSPDFINFLSNLEKAAVFYLKPFYNETAFKDAVNLTPNLSETSWIHCCLSESPCQEFNTILSSLGPLSEYETLLNILHPLLFHFTGKEWSQSSLLLKSYFEHFSPDQLCNSIPTLFPKSNLLLYAVIRTLLDCLTFILKHSKPNKKYIANCFTNSVLNLLDQECHLELLLNVFLDCCQFASMFDTDILNALSPLLIDLRKRIALACRDQFAKDNYLQLILASVGCLPDTEVKTCLLDQFRDTFNNL